MSIVIDKQTKEKEEIINLLIEQKKVEGEIISLHNAIAKTIQNKPVKHLLHMISLDSSKHLDICQTALEILQGKNILQKEKNELEDELKKHVELEKGSIDRANRMLKNIWIKENKALKEILKKLRDDEKRHHKTLLKLTKKTFFRLDENDWVTLFRDPNWLEKRYSDSLKKKK